jgi:NAD(P)H-nitrite reductase large subunit
VVLADGTVLPADAVLVAVGAQPNTELAEAAGLPVDNGVARRRVAGQRRARHLRGRRRRQR